MNYFVNKSSKSANQPKDKLTDNPYFNARRSWNDNVKALAVERQTLILLALLALLVGLAGVGGMTYIGSQTKFVPHIIQVDKLGQALAIGPAEGLNNANKQLVVRARLASFISDARIVTPDSQVQADAVYRVYASITQSDPAMEKMNHWYNSSEQARPFVRAQKETVSVQIDSALPLSDETWQLDWTETTRDRQGFEVKPPEKWRALVTVYLVSPTHETTEEQLFKNPLGIYVKDVSWSKQLGGQP
ncbi:MAG: VirB8/TrbF family protein [Methylobacter sp.]|nr:VirB8/TrbF family protein [Methylobacter sp.]